VHFWQSVGSAEYCNVFHFLETVEATELSGANVLAAAFETNVIPALINALTSEATFLQIEVQRVLPNMAVRAQTFLVDSVGSHTGNVLTQNAAFVISWYTGQAGPRNRGRNWFSGIPRLVHNLGVLIDPYREGFADAIRAALLLPMSDAGEGAGQFDLCVFHRADPEQKSSIQYPAVLDVTFTSQETAGANAFLSSATSDFTEEDIQVGGLVTILGSSVNDGTYTISAAVPEAISLDLKDDFTDESPGALVDISTDHSFGTFVTRGVVKAPVFTQKARRAERKTTVTAPV
jgi:hypothetical protein